MYWLRVNTLIDVALFLLLCSGWAVGGWLLVSHSFRLRHTERIVSGLAAGFLLFISLSNLLAHVLSTTPAFWIGSILILLSGAGSAMLSKKEPWLVARDLRPIWALAGLAIFTVLFTIILRGEAIFDEYLHLPLISIMAAGEIPPHFYLNPGFYFAYHYGLQVFAASLVRVAGLFTWSAWDISRAVAIAFTLVLGWIWVRRVTHSKLAAWLGSFLFTFGGGARWLLLLLPASWLTWLSGTVHLIGTGLDTAPTLAAALHKTWVIEGAGPVALPFAFYNGIFVPVFFNLASTGAMPFMTILLLLLLAPRGRFSTIGLIIWTLLLASLALSAEHLFAVIWAGIALAGAPFFIRRKRTRQPLPAEILWQWGGILSLSALLSLVQGGFITETARNAINAISGITAQSYNAGGFSLRWPPGLLSGHLGNLSIANPGQLVALLAELGPALLIIPLLFIGFKKKLVRNTLFSSGLALSIIIGLVLPLTMQYEVDRSTTRMPATALWTALVLGFPIIWMIVPRINHAKWLVIAIGYVVIVLGGVVIFRTQLYSMTSAQYTYYIDGLDASYAVDYWDKLPIGTQVLDRIPERSVTIFGRISRSSSGIYTPLPGWEALVADPDPRLVAASGFDYIYMDNTWWENLSSTQQAIFEQSCIDIVDEREQDKGKDYRLLVDISACKP